MAAQSSIVSFDFVARSIRIVMRGFLHSLRRPVDNYLRERVRHERAWLTQTLQRALDRRLGRPGAELELFQHDLNAFYAGMEGGGHERC